MKNVMIALICATWLVGCGGSEEDEKPACEVYNDAYVGCAETAYEAGLNPYWEEPTTSACSFFDDTDEVWACRTEAYNSADCTDEQSYWGIDDAIDACG